MNVTAEWVQTWIMGAVFAFVAIKWGKQIFGSGEKNGWRGEVRAMVNQQGRLIEKIEETQDHLTKSLDGLVAALGHYTTEGRKAMEAVHNTARQVDEIHREVKGGGRA